LVAQTWTPRTVLALFPKYIYGRFAGYDEEGIAREAGVSMDAITFDSLGSLAYAPLIAKDGILSVARYRWRIPYQSTDPWTDVWNELVSAGLAMRVGAGWSLTERGVHLCDHLHRAARDYLVSLNVEPVAIGRLTVALSPLAAGIPTDAERAMCAHRGLPLQEEIRSDIVRVDRAISELWNFRDDSHIGAWQAAGYEGPTLDVLSRIWEGKETMDEVAAELEWRQERTDIERRVALLVESGDLERHGVELTLTKQGKKHREMIEHETDARYFQGWPDSDDLARLGDDLTALVAAVTR
jgi:hypothetical protein